MAPDFDFPILPSTKLGAASTDARVSRSRHAGSVGRMPVDEPAPRNDGLFSNGRSTY